MRLTDIPFQTTDWASVAATRRPGAHGVATSRTKQHGDVRVRVVEYSPGYVADHWCDKGHILFLLEGELHTELRDGRVVVLKPGMSYEVSDGAVPHRSRTATGAKLFLVD
jgi:hypothetical protein